MQSNFAGNTDVSFLIKNLDNLIQRYIQSLYKRSEVRECSLMNMWISDFLYDNRTGNIYQKDIEAEFFINRATASKMLTLMEEKELVRRVASGDDARLKKIELLPKGYELHKIYVTMRREIENKLTETMSREEVENFKSICRQMMANIETVW